MRDLFMTFTFCYIFKYRPMSFHEKHMEKLFTVIFFRNDGTIFKAQG